MTDTPDIDADELYSRQFMIMGVDKNGDSHLFSTADLGRAVERYKLMSATMTEVRGNWGFDDATRPERGGVN